MCTHGKLEERWWSTSLGAGLGAGRRKFLFDERLQRLAAAAGRAPELRNLGWMLFEQRARPGIDK